MTFNESIFLQQFSFQNSKSPSTSIQHAWYFIVLHDYECGNGFHSHTLDHEYGNEIHSHTRNQLLLYITNGVLENTPFVMNLANFCSQFIKRIVGRCTWTRAHISAVKRSTTQLSRPMLKYYHFLKPLSIIFTKNATFSKSGPMFFEFWNVIPIY